MLKNFRSLVFSPTLFGWFPRLSSLYHPHSGHLLLWLLPLISRGEKKSSKNSLFTCGSVTEGGFVCSHHGCGWDRYITHVFLWMDSLDHPHNIR